MQQRKIIMAVTGASGAVYASILIEKIQKLSSQIDEVGVVITENARQVWEYELGNNNYENIPFPVYDRKNFYAPFASGSSKFDTMIICPCSMGMLGRIASGISDDLISRAADVMLKEHRKLILVTRETPLNLIHIENMRSITLSGGIICPASPSFYSRATTIKQIAATVIDRVLDLSGFDISPPRWGNLADEEHQLKNGE